MAIRDYSWSFMVIHGHSREYFKHIIPLKHPINSKISVPLYLCIENKNVTIRSFPSYQVLRKQSYKKEVQGFFPCTSKSLC
jgi:hypothetical protein